MDEKVLNRWIANSFDWAYKIPDPAPGSSLSAAPRPYDGIAISEQYGFIAWEAKLSKKLGAFSFARIADHQISNLLTGKQLLKKTGHPSYFVVILGVWIPRKGIKAWVFDVELINSLRQTGKKSFTKRDLEALDGFTHQSKNEKFVFDLDTKVVREWGDQLNLCTPAITSMQNS